METLQGKKWYLVLVLCLAISIIGVTAGAADKKVKIGVIGPMKNLVGIQQWMGAQLAAAEINKAGGFQVGGETYGIELVKIDDNNLKSVSDAVSAIERAVTIEKVGFLTGGGRSEAMLAQQEVMAKHKVIYLNTSSGALEMNMRIAQDYDKYKYWFRVGMFNARFTGALIFANVEMVANAIRRELGIAKPRVAIMAEKVMWPDAIIKAAKAKLPKMGMEFVGEWRPSSWATDVTAEFMAIKKAGAHIIWAITGASPAVWLKPYGELGIPAALIEVSSMGDSMREEFWEISAGNCNYEIVASYVAHLPDRPFYDNFNKKFKTDPTFHALTYDAVQVWKEAAMRAGTIESDAVVAELEKTDYQSFRGRIAFFPKDSPLPHDLIWGPKHATGFGVQWQNGKLLPVWPAGHAVLGDERWKGVKFQGIVDYKLPPRMVKYWKGKK